MKVIKDLLSILRKKYRRFPEIENPASYVFFSPTVVVVPLNYIINMKYKHCKYTMFTFTYKT